MCANSFSAARVMTYLPLAKKLPRAWASRKKLIAPGHGHASRGGFQRLHPDSSQRGVTSFHGSLSPIPERNENPHDQRASSVPPARQTVSTQGLCPKKGVIGSDQLNHHG